MDRFRITWYCRQVCPQAVWTEASANRSLTTVALGTETSIQRKQQIRNLFRPSGVARSIRIRSRPLIERPPGASHRRAMEAGCTWALTRCAANPVPCIL